MISRIRRQPITCWLVGNISAVMCVRRSHILLVCDWLRACVIAYSVETFFAYYSHMRMQMHINTSNSSYNCTNMQMQSKLKDGMGFIHEWWYQIWLKDIVLLRVKPTVCKQPYAHVPTYLDYIFNIERVYTVSSTARLPLSFVSLPWSIGTIYAILATVW